MCGALELLTHRVPHAPELEAEAAIAPGPGPDFGEGSEEPTNIRRPGSVVRRELTASRTLRISLLAIALMTACSNPDPGARGSSVIARPPLDGPTELADPALGPLRDELADMVANGELVSLSVGVAKDGRVVWAESFGLADREAGRTATPDTPYLLASLSKSVGATALMTLVEGGSISLADPVNELIAPLALTGYGGNDSGRVTVRDLLHSSGGVPHGWFATADPSDLPRREAFLPWSGMLVFPPSEVWEYSNFSLGLTEVVAEKVAGEGYEKLIDRVLFTPLGMNDAAARYVESMAETSAVRYSSSLSRLESRGGAMPLAGLGMFASVNDLLAYGMFNLDPGEAGPLSRASLELMHDYEGLSEIFGLGWYDVNETLVSNGSSGGTNTHLAIHRAAGLVVVALTNMTSPNAVTDQIVERIKSFYVEPLPEEQSYGYEEYAAVYANPYEPTPAFVGRWDGRLAAPGLPETPAALTFDGDGSATLTIDGAEPLALERLVFNTRQRFEASTTGEFPALFPEDGGVAAEVTIRPTLLKRGDRLAGYLQIERGGETYSYAVGVFAEFVKTR